MNIFYKLVIILSFLIFNDSKSNDFPTQARSEFVFACMSSNESNRDFMAKCSCAIDEIAKRISYEEYAQAEAIARLWEGAAQKKHLKVLGYLKTECKSYLERRLHQSLNVSNYSTDAMLEVENFPANC